MAFKEVVAQHPAQKIQMDQLMVDQALPVADLDQWDPVLLIHHGFDYLEAGWHPRQSGVGPHPHRGFSPITFVIRGDVHHRDSRGNSSVVKAGGMQWMDAGMGITHSERPSAEFAETGGPMEIVQCWINLPAAKKMEQPRYQAIQDIDVPTYHTSDQLAELRVYAGNQWGLTGPVQPRLPFEAYRIDLKKGGKLSLNLPDGLNAVLYNLRDTMLVNNANRLFVKEAMFLGSEENDVALEAMGDTICIVLAGKPIGEKVTKYGPFVMNSQTEVLEALRDSQLGKMGILIEEF
ncbi:MAG: pirin family protein [Flavobacteriales bacterium]|nr:pirin family protein [Flavobacteriales bacterium]